MGLEELILEKERAEARAEGIEQGIEKKEIEIVLSLDEDGFEVPRIAKVTKLSIEQVEKILRENRKNG